MIIYISGGYRVRTGLRKACIINDVVPEDELNWRTSLQEKQIAGYLPYQTLSS